MKWRKLLYQPVQRMSDCDITRDALKGSAVIDGDWVERHCDAMLKIAERYPQVQGEIATEMSHFLYNCHCGSRAYEYLWNIPETNWFQRVGSFAYESVMWRRDHPRAWAKFCKENGITIKDNTKKGTNQNG